MPATLAATQPPSAKARNEPKTLNAESQEADLAPGAEGLADPMSAERDGHEPEDERQRDRRQRPDHTPLHASGQGTTCLPRSP